jgi:hypothetical protein
MEVPSFVPNYTGPYISDGKFQSSVLFGKTPPKNALDFYSRLHDSAYAQYDDWLHRTVADLMYKEQVKNLGFEGHLAAQLVTYGNFTARSAENLIMTSFKLPQIIYGGVKNMYNLNQLLMHEKEVRRELTAFWATDPYHYSLSNSLPQSTSLGNSVDVVRRGSSVAPSDYVTHTAIGKLVNGRFVKDVPNSSVMQDAVTQTEQAVYEPLVDQSTSGPSRNQQWLLDANNDPNLFRSLNLGISHRRKRKRRRRNV